MPNLRKVGAILGVTMAAAAMTFVGVRERQPVALDASSHREAPGISNDPTADTTDLYVWVSPDARDSVTMVLNTWPFADPFGGPNFFLFGNDVRYTFNIDNDGDAMADIMYDFTFRTEYRNPETFLYNTGPVTSLDDADLNIRQFYTVTRRDGAEIGRAQRSTEVMKDVQVAPVNVGPKSTPNYDALAQAAVKPLPGGGKVFAGLRDDPFFVDIAALVDLLTIRPGPPGNMGGGANNLAGFNVNSIVMQVPMSAVVGNSGPIIGTWITTSRGTTGAAPANAQVGDQVPLRYSQVSRLGHPLVNEVVLPLKLKDAFNTIDPTQDAVALPYVTDPIVPKLLNALYGINSPPAPRNDLVTIFLTGIPDLNQPPGVKASEMLRLNMSIPPAASPNRMGLLGGDNAGFPNGRRPADDVVDIELRALAGGTPFTPAFNVAPNNQLGDGVDANDLPFMSMFPYLATPHQSFESAGGVRKVPTSNP